MSVEIEENVKLPPEILASARRGRDRYKFKDMKPMNARGGGTLVTLSGREDCRKGKIRVRGVNQELEGYEIKELEALREVDADGKPVKIVLAMFKK